MSNPTKTETPTYTDFLDIGPDDPEVYVVATGEEADEWSRHATLDDARTEAGEQGVGSSIWTVESYDADRSSGPIETSTVAAYLCDDGNAEVRVDAESAEDAAQEYVDDGDWGLDDHTIWVTVWVQPVSEHGHPIGDRDSYRITLDPSEPSCSHEDGHDWQSPIELVGGIESNPGVRGHGGGVVMTDVCLRCGCERVRDTWAQDPEDGTQGLDSVCYEPGAWTAEVEKMQADDDED